jgi:Uncharacterized protein conserved in bacteria (DUF2188)
VTTREGLHTIHRSGIWLNEVEGDGVLSRYITKDEAVAAGRAEAIRRRLEHVVYNMDGTIAERTSYDDDPVPEPAE